MNPMTIKVVKARYEAIQANPDAFTQAERDWMNHPRTQAIINDRYDEYLAEQQSIPSAPPEGAKL